MSFLSQPIDDLVQVLVTETRAGRISWEPADAFNTAFIAKRPSGTVIVRGAAGLPLTASLEVKDAKGRTVDEATAGTIGMPIGRSLLPDLLLAAQQQVETSRRVVSNLTREFRTPD